MHPVARLPSVWTPDGLSNAVVIGMHRSGTSAVTGCLVAMGYSAPTGDNAIHAPDNPEHWESRTLVRRSEQLLRASSGSWENPPQPAHDMTMSEESWAIEARTELNVELPTQPWAMKDPRLCLTLPAWRPFLPDDARYVFVVRHPASVSSSLMGRNGFSEVRATALWDRYYAAAERNLQGLPVHVLVFEALRRRPREELRSLSKFLSGADLGSEAVLDRAVQSLRADLGRDPEDSNVSRVVAPRYRQLVGQAGSHLAYTSDVEPENPWVLEVMRCYRSQYLEEERQRQRLLTRLTRLARQRHWSRYASRIGKRF